MEVFFSGRRRPLKKHAWIRGGHDGTSGEGAKFYSDLNPSTMITGGVIDYAESLPICFRTISVNERTSQTPSTLNYGTGYIEKSGETDIVIILHNVVTKETYTKRRSNIGWGDWETYALKSDLANKTKSGSATISTKQNDSTALQIRFDKPFPSRPYVTVSLNADNANTNTKISVFDINQTGFKVSIYDTATTTRRIEWIASV